MLRLIEREFEVNVPLETAWDKLADIEDWASWGTHFRRCEVTPPGKITPESTANLYLKVGPVTKVKVVEFNLHENWRWDGAFLWMTIRYDHRFEAIDENRTKMIWILDGEGFGINVLGRVFASIYNQNLNRAIPNLIHQLENSS